MLTFCSFLAKNFTVLKVFDHVVHFRYYNNRLIATFENHLRGGHEFQPPRLMPGINRGDHILLTEIVTTTTSQNILTEAGIVTQPPW